MTKMTDNEDQAGPPRSGPSASGFRGKTALWIALALLVGFVAGVFLTRHILRPTAPPPQNATLEEARPDLAQRTALVDLALRTSLKALRPDALAPLVLSTDQREHAGQHYAYQTLRLPQVDRQALHARLVKELASAVPSARLTRITAETWDISIDGLATHRLNLPAEAPPEPPVKPAKGRLAIVIDDMGEDVALAQELARLGAPVAFSIWPDSSQREAVLKIAKAAGREILIHLPMQPKHYPQVKPGPHPLLLSMGAEEIKATVRRAVTRVHGAIGVNNHMGSEFTESNLGMRLALTALQDSGLFFLDSRTTAATVGVAEAKRLGLRVYQRDVFLDNEQDAAAILRQLRKAEATARERGHAIAIGHPHKETVQALRQWLRDKDKAVQVVTVSSLPPI